MLKNSITMNTKTTVKIITVVFVVWGLSNVRMDNVSKIRY